MKTKHSDLNDRQLLGLDESALVETSDGHRLLPAVAKAFAQLQEDARLEGFQLAIASSYRSYERQLAIFNAKARGDRPVHDDSGHLLDLENLPPDDRLTAIMRFSALPGTSRHHWGTDLDVYDAAAVPVDYQVQLTPAEVEAGGVFAPLHDWLDLRMAEDRSRGFFRPYDIDRGGVAPERWHLSYAPLAGQCSGRLTAQMLLGCWNSAEGDEVLLLRDQICLDLPALLSRYVDTGRDWCPGNKGDSTLYSDDDGATVFWHPTE